MITESEGREAYEPNYGVGQNADRVHDRLRDAARLV